MRVTSVVVGMLVCVAAAVVILLLVALPRFREGEPFLTEEGEEVLAEARRRTRALAAQARERAAEAAQQAAEQAKAARERVATLSSGDEDDADRPDGDQNPDGDTQLGAPPPAAERVQMPVPPTPEPAPDATRPEPEPETADVRDGVHVDEDATHEDDVIDLRDPVGALDGHPNGRLTEKRGAHRRLNDITFGEPLPGPRHGR